MKLKKIEKECRSCDKLVIILFEPDVEEAPHHCPFCTCELDAGDDA